MFDIGFGELMLVMVIGLVVLGPERLPVAVKTVASWIRTLRSLASTVQNELTQELKLQELQDSLKKVEKASLSNLSPELKASMDELKEAAESMRRGYTKPLDSAVSLSSADLAATPLGDAEAEHDGVIAAEQAAKTSSVASAPLPGVVSADAHPFATAPTTPAVVDASTLDTAVSATAATSSSAPQDKRVTATAASAAGTSQLRDDS